MSLQTMTASCIQSTMMPYPMHLTHIELQPSKIPDESEYTHLLLAGRPKLVGHDGVSVYFDLAGGTYKCGVGAWCDRDEQRPIPATQVVAAQQQLVALYVVNRERLLVGPETCGHLAGGASRILILADEVKCMLGGDEEVIVKAVPYHSARELPRGEMNHDAGFIPW